MTREEAKRRMRELETPEQAEERISTGDLGLEETTTDLSKLTREQAKYAMSLIDTNGESKYSQGRKLAEKEGSFINSLDNRDTLTSYHNAYTEALNRAVSNKDEVAYYKNRMLLDSIDQKLGRTASPYTAFQDVGQELATGTLNFIAGSADKIAQAKIGAVDSLDANVLYNIAKAENGTLKEVIDNYGWGKDDWKKLTILHSKYPDDKIITDLYNTVSKQGYKGDIQYFKDVVADINNRNNREKLGEFQSSFNPVPGFNLTNQDIYNRIQTLDTKESLSYNSLGKLLLDGVGVAANMIIPAATGAVVGKAAEGLGVATKADNIRKGTTIGLMSASAAGAATNQALQEGYEWNRASIYGDIMGIVEGLTEQIGGEFVNSVLFGGNAATPTGKVLAKFIKDHNITNRGIKLGLTILADVNAEGLEEVAADFVEPFVRQAVLGDKNAFEDWGKNMGEAYVQSIVPTIIMGGFGLAQARVSIDVGSKYLENQIMNNTQFTNEQKAEMIKGLQAAANDAKVGLFENYETITNEINRQLEEAAPNDEKVRRIRALIASNDTLTDQEMQNVFDKYIAKNNLQYNPYFGTTQELLDTEKPAEISYKNQMQVDIDAGAIMGANGDIEEIDVVTNTNQAKANVQKLLTKVAKVLGKDQVVLANITAKDGLKVMGVEQNGVDTIFVNAELDPKDMLAAGFHELGHVVEEKHPQVFKYFKSALERAAGANLDKILADYNNIIGKYETNTFTEDQKNFLVGELLGDHVGEWMSKLKNTKAIEQSTKSLIDNLKQVVEKAASTITGKEVENQDVSAYNLNLSSYLDNNLLNDNTLNNMLLKIFEGKQVDQVKEVTKKTEELLKKKEAPKKPVQRETTKKQSTDVNSRIEQRYAEMKDIAKTPEILRMIAEETGMTYDPLIPFSQGGDNARIQDILTDLRDDGKITETGTRLSAKKYNNTPPKNKSLVNHDYSTMQEAKYSNKISGKKQTNNDNQNIKWGKNERKLVVAAIDTNFPNLDIGSEYSIPFNNNIYYFVKKGPGIYEFTYSKKARALSGKFRSRSIELYGNQSKNGVVTSRRDSNVNGDGRRATRIGKLSSKRATNNAEPDTTQGIRNTNEKRQRKTKLSARKDSKQSSFSLPEEEPKLSSRKKPKLKMNFKKGDTSKLFYAIKGQLDEEKIMSLAIKLFEEDIARYNETVENEEDKMYYDMDWADYIEPYEEKATEMVFNEYVDSEEGQKFIAKQLEEQNKISKAKEEILDLLLNEIEDNGFYDDELYEVFKEEMDAAGYPSDYQGWYDDATDEMEELARARALNKFIRTEEGEKFIEENYKPKLSARRTDDKYRNQINFEYNQIPKKKDNLKQLDYIKGRLATLAKGVQVAPGYKIEVEEFEKHPDAIKISLVHNGETEKIIKVFNRSWLQRKDTAPIKNIRMSNYRTVAGLENALRSAIAQEFAGALDASSIVRNAMKSGDNTLAEQIGIKRETLAKARQQEEAKQEERTKRKLEAANKKKAEQEIQDIIDTAKKDNASYNKAIQNKGKIIEGLKERVNRAEPEVRRLKNTNKAMEDTYIRQIRGYISESDKLLKTGRKTEYRLKGQLEREGRKYNRLSEVARDMKFELQFERKAQADGIKYGRDYKNLFIGLRASGMKIDEAYDLTKSIYEESQRLNNAIDKSLEILTNLRKRKVYNKLPNELKEKINAYDKFWSKSRQQSNLTFAKRILASATIKELMGKVALSKSVQDKITDYDGKYSVSLQEAFNGSIALAEQFAQELEALRAEVAEFQARNITAEKAQELEEERTRISEDVAYELNRQANLKTFKFKKRFTNSTLATSQMTFKTETQALMGGNINTPLMILEKNLQKGEIRKKRAVVNAYSMLNDMLTKSFGINGALGVEKWKSSLSKILSLKSDWEDTGIVVKGKELRLPRSMIMSLAMHLQNDQNMSHISGAVTNVTIDDNGDPVISFKEGKGLRVPNETLYKRGRINEAYDAGRNVKLDYEQVQQLVSTLTEEERQFVEATRKIFDYTSKLINEVSNKLYGYDIAIVENYFPIHVWRADQDIDALRDSKLGAKALSVDAYNYLTEAGWLQDRVTSFAPIYLENIAQVVDRYINNISTFYGYAEALRDNNIILNTTFEEPVEFGDGQETETLRDAIGSLSSAYLADYDRLTRYIVGAEKQREGFARGWLALNTLTFNLGTWLTQPMSFFNTLKYYTTKDYMSGINPINNNIKLNNMIRQYYEDLGIDTTNVGNYELARAFISMATPNLDYRAIGYKKPDIRQLYNKRFAEKLGAHGIEAFDNIAVTAVARLEAWVLSQEEGLEFGSEEYFQRLGAELSQILVETQPEFSQINRANMFRSTNGILRMLSLFGTPANQMFNNFVQAALEVRYEAREGKVSKNALATLAKSMSGIIVSSIMVGLVRALRDAIRYEEEDTEIQERWIAQSIVALLGPTLILDDLAQLIMSSKGFGGISSYDFNSPETTFMNGIQTLINKIGQLGNDNISPAKKTVDLIKALGVVTPVDTRSIVRIVTQLMKVVSPDAYKAYQLQNNSNYYKQWLKNSDTDMAEFYSAYTATREKNLIANYGYHKADKTKNIKSNLKEAREKALKDVLNGDQKKVNQYMEILFGYKD